MSRSRRCVDSQLSLLSRWSVTGNAMGWQDRLGFPHEIDAIRVRGLGSEALASGITNEQQNSSVTGKKSSDHRTSDVRKAGWGRCFILDQFSEGSKVHNGCAETRQRMSAILTDIRLLLEVRPLDDVRSHHATPTHRVR